MFNFFVKIVIDYSQIFKLSLQLKSYFTESVWLRQKTYKFIHGWQEMLTIIISIIPVFMQHPSKMQFSNIKMIFFCTGAVVAKCPDTRLSFRLTLIIEETLSFSVSSLLSTLACFDS